MTYFCVFLMYDATPFVARAPRAAWLGVELRVPPSVFDSLSPNNNCFLFSPLAGIQVCRR